MLRYLIRLDNRMKWRPQQIKGISSEFARVGEKFDASVKNLRISEIAIEFDLFARNAISKDLAVEALVLDYGRLLSERNLGETSSGVQNKREIVRLVMELFNKQRYWECHEVMEEIWRREKDIVEKDLQQGVILVASALVHAQKNENNVCVVMLSKALKKLNQWTKRDYHGMEIGSLKTHVEEMVESRQISFPKISSVASR